MAGAINGYLIDFYDHLRTAVEHRENFQQFYPFWDNMRNETIQSLESLITKLENVEFYCDAGIAATSAVGVGCGLSTLIGFLMHGIVSPVGVGVSAGAHALKTGINAEKAAEISRARCTASDLIQIDYNETVDFVQMGLRFDGIFRKMREIVENIRQMTLSYTMDQLMEALGTFPDLRGNNAAAPHRELAQAIVDGANAVAEVDVDNVSMILNWYLQNNPDVGRAFTASAQAGFDLVGLIGLMNINIIGDVDPIPVCCRLHSIYDTRHP